MHVSGVYSGYIPSYPSDGRYKVSVRVSSSSESASTFPQGEVTTRGHHHQMCCGSSTRAPRSKMIPAMTFTSSVAGPSLLLTNTEDRTVMSFKFESFKLLESSCTMRRMILCQ